MKKLAMVSMLLLIASTALASNTGFKLNYDITVITGTLNNVPISLPYFYFPGGQIEVPQRAAATVNEEGIGCSLPPLDVVDRRAGGCQ
ncbi:hypothetical protein ACFLU6_10925, partial [Acidobacteriota bacterium]